MQFIRKNKFEMFSGLNHFVKGSILFQSIYNFDKFGNVIKAINFQSFSFWGDKYNAFHRVVCISIFIISYMITTSFIPSPFLLFLHLTIIVFIADELTSMLYYNFLLYYIVISNLTSIVFI